MKYVYEVEEYSQDSRHYTVESEVTLADIDDDVLTPENKININVTFNYVEYGDDSQVNITGSELEEE